MIAKAEVNHTFPSRVGDVQTIAVDSVSVKDILLVARPHEQKEADLPLTDSDEEVVSEKNAISNEVLFARQDFSAKINDVSKL